MTYDFFTMNLRNPVVCAWVCTGVATWFVSGVTGAMGRAFGTARANLSDCVVTGVLLFPLYAFMWPVCLYLMARVVRR